VLLGVLVLGVWLFGFLEERFGGSMGGLGLGWL